MKYRAEIDGLRSIAIIPVLLYHIDSNILPYGYLGVDIFFLISGYLISSIITEKLKIQNFSILEFYERRIKRIAPLYFLIIFVSIPIATFLLFPHQLVDFSKSIVASLFFISNFFFYGKIDYFNPFIEYSPLIHTWSLSVEEQFYLFLPPFMILIRNFSNKIKVFCFSVLAFLSMFYCFSIIETDVSLAFYSSFSRAWELLFGVILSFVRIGSISPKQKKIINIVGLISLLLLMSFYFGIIKFKHPGPLTVLPIILTCIIILFSEKDNVLNKILRTPVLVHIGLLSYSLYLIHQPVLAFFKVWVINNNHVSENKIIEGFLLLVLIYLLSLASYKFFENPIRHMKVSRKKVFVSFVFLTIFFSGFGYYGYITGGLKQNYIDKYADVIMYDRDEVIKTVKQERVFYDKQGNDTLSGKNNDILIIGDSMASDLWHALRLVNTEENLNLHKINIDDPCLNDLSKYLISEINTSLKCGTYSEDSKNIENLIKNSSTVIFTCMWSNKTYEDGLNIAKLIYEKYHKKVIIIGPAQFSDINIISVDIAKKNIVNDSIDTFIKNHHTINNKITINQMMKKITNEEINFIDKFEFFKTEKGYNLFYKDGYPKLFDSEHMSKRCLEEWGKFILKEIH